MAFGAWSSFSDPSPGGGSNVSADCTSIGWPAVASVVPDAGASAVVSGGGAGAVGGGAGARGGGAGGGRVAGGAGAEGGAGPAAAARAVRQREQDRGDGDCRAERDHRRVAD